MAFWKVWQMRLLGWLREVEKMPLSLKYQNIEINEPLNTRVAGSYPAGSMSVCLSIFSVECIKLENSASYRTYVWLCVCVCVLY
jgi:hypothetical protein